jgi:hypothetical protein
MFKYDGTEIVPYIAILAFIIFQLALFGLSMDLFCKAIWTVSFNITLRDIIRDVKV